VAGAGSPGGARGPRRWRRWALLAGAALVVGLGGAALVVASVRSLRWRARLIYARVAHDEFAEIPTRDFLRWLRAGSAVDLFPLLEKPNVRAAIRNGFREPEDVRRGARVFATNCARCHGDSGRGNAGPSLVAAIGGLSDWNFFATVKWGKRGTAMLPQPITDAEIWQTHTFVRTLVRPPTTTDGRQLSIDVALDDAAFARTDGWLTYGGNYAGHHHSALARVTRRNVGELRLAWAAQLPATDEALQATPLVAGGALFVSAANGSVVALDATTGAKLWQYSRPLPKDVLLCCGSGNRGVALLGKSVFVATLDAHLVALDAATGEPRWETQVADVRDGYSMTAAPLAVGDRLIVGIAGGDYGARGFVAAFAAADGHRLWQRSTVPPPGEAGHESWAGDSWKTGGAGTWMTGAYDAALGLVYWGVGNAAPVYRNDTRAGDDLYASSVIAFEPTTGAIRWHYQFTPSDEHDWDAAQQPVLADVDWKGARVPALLTPNRNAFFYALDRRTGAFLFAKAFTKQTWNRGFDDQGRPDVDPTSRPSEAGTLVWPWAGGATNWQPPSFDAARGLVFAPVVEAGGIFFRDKTGQQEGQIFRGGAAQPAGSGVSTTAVEAIDAATGAARWTAKLDEGVGIHLGVGGLLSTDGGLVFVGTNDELRALDADTGLALWRVRLGGTISAAPIAYSMKGEELIAIVAGKTLFAFSLPPPPHEHP
jgi:alcohol dehydrogenase (cytochrome c)